MLSYWHRSCLIFPFKQEHRREQSSSLRYPVIRQTVVLLAAAVTPGGESIVTSGKRKPRKDQEAMMKFFKALICTTLIALFLVAGTAFQGSQAMAAGKEAKEVEIFGTVQNSPNGFIIMSEGKQYRIEGQDLSTMKGKMVTVKGTVSEEGGKRVVNVTSVKEKE
jgi:hypothetical protein